MYQEVCTWGEREGSDRSPVRFSHTVLSIDGPHSFSVTRAAKDECFGCPLAPVQAKPYKSMTQEFSYIREELHTSSEESGQRIIDMLYRMHLCTRNRSTHQFFWRMRQPAIARSRSYRLPGLITDHAHTIFIHRTEDHTSKLASLWSSQSGDDKQSWVP